MSRQSVNLNLLPLMQALLKHRSVTAAGRSLGISQSAASQGLARLREQMNDPLLVRIRGRMQLTPLAMAMAARVDRITTELDDLFEPSRFNPATAVRTFVVAANDYMVHMLGKTMVDLQSAMAPDIEIHFIEFGPDFIERLAAQEIDFALLPRFVVRDLTVAPLRYRTLFSDRAGALMDRKHPLAAKAIIDETDVAAYGCVAFFVDAFERIPSKHWRPPPEVAPSWQVMRKVAVRTNHFNVIPSLLCDTNLISLIPYGIGLELSKRWPTVVRPLSFGPALVEHGLAWSPVFDADAGHIWFRTEVINRIAALQARREVPCPDGTELNEHTEDSK